MEPTDWITAIATVVLVLVTMWYAKTTSDISQAGVRSAKAAEEAAKEAAKSAAAAVATVGVDFQIRPAYRFPADKEHEYQTPEGTDKPFNLGVRLANRGAAVHVHDVTFSMFYRMTKPEPGVRAAQGEPMDETALRERTKGGPERMHSAEQFYFWSPATWIPRGYLAGIAVTVRYSIDGQETFEYKARWWGEEGVDFDFISNDLLSTSEPITPTPGDRWSIRTPGQGEGMGVKWKKLEVSDLFVELEESEG